MGQDQGCKIKFELDASFIWTYGFVSLVMAVFDVRPADRGRLKSPASRLQVACNFVRRASLFSFILFVIFFIFGSIFCIKIKAKAADLRLRGGDARLEVQ